MTQVNSIYESYNNLENVQILTFFHYVSTNYILSDCQMPDTKLGSGTYFLEYKKVKDMIFSPHDIWVGGSKQNIVDTSVVILE